MGLNISSGITRSPSSGKSDGDLGEDVLEDGLVELFAYFNNGLLLGAPLVDQEDQALLLANICHVHGVHQADRVEQDAVHSLVICAQWPRLRIPLLVNRSLTRQNDQAYIHLVDI